jgi:hypothetical protein
LNDVQVATLKEDRRPAFVLDSVDGVEFENCKAARVDGVPALVMMKAKSVSAHHCAGLADFQGDSLDRKEM